MQHEQVSCLGTPPLPFLCSWVLGHDKEANVYINIYYVLVTVLIIVIMLFNTDYNHVHWLLLLDWF